MTDNKAQNAALASPALPTDSAPRRASDYL